MASLRIDLLRSSYGDLPIAELARLVAQDDRNAVRPLVILSYRSDASVKTDNLAICRTEEDVTSYYKSSACHDVQIVYVDPNASAPKRRPSSTGLWFDVPTRRPPLALNSEIRARLADPLVRADSGHHARLALAASTNLYSSIPREAFYLFGLDADATVIYKMPTARTDEVRAECDLFVEAVEMPTYPLLHVGLDFPTRHAPGQSFRCEAVSDLTDGDVQEFFSCLLCSGAVCIHAVEDDLPVPRFTVRLSFDKPRIDYYAEELRKAATAFKKIPGDKLSYQQAVTAFFPRAP